MKIFHSIAMATLVSFAIAGIAKDKAALPKEAPFKLSEIEKNGSRKEEGIAPLAKSAALHRISGQIAALSKSMMPFKVGGVIQKFVAKPGDTVKKGDIIAILDPADYELQLNLAKVNKHQAELQENIAKSEFNREKKLKDEGTSSGSMFDSVEFKFKQAQIGVQLADLNLKMAQRNLDNTKLRAPYNCVVASKLKDIAERVGPETPVFELYEIGKSEVQLNAPEVLIGKLSVGSKLTIQVPSVGFRDMATVTKIVPVVMEHSRTFKVMAELSNNDARVVPGLFAEAHMN